MARRETDDPSGLGFYPNWCFAWPANRRILYNRASADLAGKPWAPHKPLVQWNGTRWVGFDVPDYGPTIKPEQSVGPFIMQQEGVARLFSRGGLRDGPFPEHYEPMEAPVANLMSPAIKGNPVARMFKEDREQLGSAEKFPIVATTYRLTEHFHYWSKHVQPNAVMQPEFFVEMSEQLAAEKGIKIGGWVKVSSNRGFVKAKAVVTKRLQPLQVDGKVQHIIGIPIHWGFTGAAKKGYGVNVLGPVVGDANSETPEFKAYLVDVEATTPPATDPAVASIATTNKPQG
jgi:formate dehydrogenase major subunit